jgi:hypothetical protein
MHDLQQVDKNVSRELYLYVLNCLLNYTDKGVIVVVIVW